VTRKKSVPGHAATDAGSAERARAPFANTTFGHLTASSACSEPGTLTIELDGELDIATAPAFEQLLTELERDRWPTIVVDLRHLNFIDSSGIRTLLAAHRRIGGLGGRMVLRDASRTVRRTLAAIGVDSILDLNEVIDEPARNGQARRSQPDPRGSTSSGDDESSPSGPRQPPSPLSLASDLDPAAGPTLMGVTNAVVTACKTHTGKGPERAKAHVRPNTLYVVLHDWMTAADHTLLDHGREDLVAESRRHLHDQVAASTRTTVENATGRIVIATRSHLDFDRNTAILAFSLGRQA
jgi:anti-anti-sigma factor